MTESTFKQFFNEKKKFNPDFDTAFKMIKGSDTNKMIFFREKNNNQNPDYHGLVLLNYAQVIINNKGHGINIINNNLESYKGKIWNICLTSPINECFEPSKDIKVTSENFLQGGLKLSLWEIK